MKTIFFFCDLNRRIHDRYVPSSCLLRFGCTFYCWLINTHQIGVAVGMRSKNRKEISGSFTAQLPIVRRVQPLCMYLSVSRLSHLLPELNFVAFFSSLQSYSHFILKTKNFFSSSDCVLTRLLLIIYSFFVNNLLHRLYFFPFFLITHRFTTGYSVLILSNAIICYGQWFYNIAHFMRCGS